MKFLFCDHSTGKKSLTVTGLILTFFFALAVGGFLLKKAVLNILSTEDVAFGFYSLSFLGIFVSLYWNKRVRMSKSGVEVLPDQIGFKAELSQEEDEENDHED